MTVLNMNCQRCGDRISVDRSTDEETSAIAYASWNLSVKHRSKSKQTENTFGYLCNDCTIAFGKFMQAYDLDEIIASNSHVSVQETNDRMSQFLAQIPDAYLLGNKEFMTRAYRLVATAERIAAGLVFSPLSVEDLEKQQDSQQTQQAQKASMSRAATAAADNIPFDLKLKLHEPALKNTAPVPSVGRIVHYVDLHPNSDERVCCAALVTHVFDDAQATPDEISCTYFTMTGVSISVAVGHDEGIKEYQTWHWPERVGGGTV